MRAIGVVAFIEDEVGYSSRPTDPNTKFPFAVNPERLAVLSVLRGAFQPLAALVLILNFGFIRLEKELPIKLSEADDADLCGRGGIDTGGGGI